MKLFGIVCLFILVVFVVPVNCDDFSTGRHLLDACSETIKKGNNYFKVGYCMGYLQGVVDEEEIRLSAGVGQPAYCMSKEVTPEQAIRTLIRYLEAHPEILHLRGASLTLNAFKEAWPCK
jgi:hypothetical protein